MAEAHENATTRDIGNDKIDPAAPAGSERSLGEESGREGRPATGDKIVEAIDEEGPGITIPLRKIISIYFGIRQDSCPGHPVIYGKANFP